MTILRGNARNCVTCSYLKVIYDINCSMKEMEEKYKDEDMDRYLHNIAYKCTNINNDGDEDERKLRIDLSFSGRNVICYLYSESITE